MTDKLKIVEKAINWLEAHPDKHIAGSLAETADGYNIDPTDPDADCFCILGRIAKEADIHTDAGQLYAALDVFLEPLWLDTEGVYEVNDRLIDEDNETKPPVIAELRELFKIPTKE